MISLSISGASAQRQREGSSENKRWGFSCAPAYQKRRQVGKAFMDWVELFITESYEIRSDFTSEKLPREERSSFYQYSSNAPQTFGTFFS